MTKSRRSGPRDGGEMHPKWWGAVVLSITAPMLLSFALDSWTTPQTSRGAPATRPTTIEPLAAPEPLPTIVVVMPSASPAVDLAPDATASQAGALPVEPREAPASAPTASAPPADLVGSDGAPMPSPSPAASARPAPRASATAGGDMYEDLMPAPERPRGVDMGAPPTPRP